ncbi:hypothetical protein [Poseidonibacter ostreae]|jgi:hypothetical protein|uniref:Chemotaxis protein n=1 Tax=Poseidonibacter ostreae TaxID=2654171 RepID=A0A6L4WP24_9BACT|nr:hypothetical protein [Poseidonibacter ostreae]KAB7885413.1 hypothetical protein GBG19_14030 [Poseidonibacter ostreae]KAB7886308.1 hypothetical protein GA417_06155 [Poseidonibacter ostreae]KAB7890028.1 hypothetical protein GBG18_09735 [Poseidonibacter ostreae]
MSMSQEEIEALMNGLDIVDDESSAVQEETPIVQEEAPVVNTEEIEELISQNEKVGVEETSELLENNNEEVVENIENTDSEVVNNNDIDNLLKDLETSEANESEKEETASNLEEISELEVEEIDTKEISDITPKTFDDEAADEEGIVESTSSKVQEEKISQDKNHDNDEIGKVWADSKINEGVFPFPADHDTKVVNQLSQVANDSEEKGSQIFDVLSLSLDNNSETRDKVKSFESYIASDLELLNSLSAKFPNIEIFKTQIKAAEEMSTNLNDITTSLNAEDMKIFEAMELMQFNDINRQKIERVMSVIRKLSLYLNNLFEDDGTSQEIAVAKHIHGDSTDDLIGEDLDKLIDEFAK